MISAQTLRVCRRENRFTFFRIMLWTGSDQIARQRNQARALLLGSNRDAQEISDPWLVEMPHQYPALAQGFRKLGAAAPRMAREYKIRR